jgi:hypothetical protein
VQAAKPDEYAPEPYGFVAPPCIFCDPPPGVHGGVYLAPAMAPDYIRTLDRARGIRMAVEFTSEGREITDYAVVLVCERGTSAETIRVYDGAHGHNEMHRYTSGAGKQSGMPFHSGTLGEGMRAAIEEIRSGYREMIEGWERQ